MLFFLIFLKTICENSYLGVALRHALTIFYYSQTQDFIWYVNYSLWTAKGNMRIDINVSEVHSELSHVWMGSEYASDYSIFQFANGTLRKKVSKCGTFSGPYFPVFGLKQTRKTPYLEIFHAVVVYRLDWIYSISISNINLKIIGYKVNKPLQKFKGSMLYGLDVFLKSISYFAFSLLFLLSIFNNIFIENLCAKPTKRSTRSFWTNIFEPKN